jgi:hypothetical protein
MRSIFRTAAMLSLASAPALAQNETAPGWTPTLELRALASWPQGAQANVSNQLRLAKNEPIAATMWTGRNLCTLGGGDRSAADAAGAPTPQNMWKLSGEYLGEREGRHQIRVTSGFVRVDGRDASASTTQTLALREGDNVVLDVMSGAVDTDCQVHTVAFDARLLMQATDPALQRARYTADLWLVHTDREGKEQREHLVMNVDGSTIVPFMFNRLAFPLPQVDPRQGDAEAVIQLTGALRARPRTDGLVDLDVETNRLLFGLENPNAPLRSTAMTVRKTLTLKEGETTAVDFPPPSSGFSTIALEKDGTAFKTFTLRAKPGGEDVKVVGRPVEVKEGKLYLYTNRFFRGHKTQLLVTLRKLG